MKYAPVRVIKIAKTLANGYVAELLQPSSKHWHTVSKWNELSVE